MGCERYGNAVVCTGPDAEVSTDFFPCHDCKRTTPQMVKDFKWYGFLLVCTGCGREVDEDGWRPFPFSREAPKLRQRNIDEAREAWTSEGSE